MFLTYTFKDAICLLYTNDPEVLKILNGLLTYYFFIAIPDILQQVVSGTLRGIGKQNFIAYLYLIIYFGFNLPAMITLVYNNYGVYEIWSVISISLTAISISLLVRFYTADMDSLIKSNKEMLSPIKLSTKERKMIDKEQ